MPDDETHLKVETPEVEVDSIQTHEWYYVCAHRTSSSAEWAFGIPVRSKQDAVDHAKFYINSDHNYEVKLIRIKMPV